MAPRIELDVSDIPPISEDLRQTFKFEESRLRMKLKPTALTVKGATLNLNMLPKWTYAQGTKMMAVAGGIKAVPLP